MKLQNKDVLYEDNHLIIVNKHSGQLSQGDKSQDPPLSDLVKDYIKVKYKKEGDVFLGIIHRLDRPVSGVIIYARTSKALERMNLLFKENQIQKTYWAVVGKYPKKEEDTLIHWLTKDKETNKAKAAKGDVPGGKKAELSYTLIQSFKGKSILEVKPKTGRPHQIRAQLASIKLPIVNDLKYGYPDSNNPQRIYLHAREIEFIHPVKKEVIRIVAPLPKNDEIWMHFSQ